MTLNSLLKLKDFLVEYKDELAGPVADYGGTEKIGEGLVVGMLSKLGNKKLKDYVLLDYDYGDDFLKKIKGKYGLGICMDLLEHVENPFLVADNISDSLKKNALLFVTCPFIWEVHAFPKDYWRFTPEGLEALFKKLKPLSSCIVRDEGNGEAVPRQRTVAVFRR